MSDVAKTDINDFKTKILEKIKGDIGDLMPPEVLADLVKQAVQEHFFQPTYHQQGYGSPERRESWFVDAVIKASEPIMAKAVAKCVKDHEDVIKDTVNEFLAGEHLTLLIHAQMHKIISDNTQNDMVNLVNNVINNNPHRAF